MDFGKILSRWEKQKRQAGESNMGKWIDKYLPQQNREDEVEGVHRNVAAAERRRRLRALKPQRQIDLHGLTASEAVTRVDHFLQDSRRDGLRKVLIIHGKGKHSKREPVLARAIRTYIQRSPHAGEFGNPTKDYGGSGAIWVILR